jgi:hypothetical protein
MDKQVVKEKNINISRKASKLYGWSKSNPTVNPGDSRKTHRQQENCKHLLNYMKVANSKWT